MPTFSYRFSIGNSNTGQVGLCFDFEMEQEKADEAAAVIAVKAALSEHGAEDRLTDLRIIGDPITHVCLYLNTALITKDDIDSVEELEDEAKAPSSGITKEAYECMYLPQQYGSHEPGKLP